MKTTRKSEFIKMYPDFPLDENGIPKMYPCLLHLFCGNWKSCKECREDFWNQKTSLMSATERVKERMKINELVKSVTEAVKENEVE